MLEDIFRSVARQFSKPDNSRHVGLESNKNDIHLIVKKNHRTIKKIIGRLTDVDLSSDIRKQLIRIISDGFYYFGWKKL